MTDTARCYTISVKINRCVRILREQSGLGSYLIQDFRGVVGIDGADRNARHALREQVLENTLLRGSRHLARDIELNVVVGELLLRFLGAAPGDLPKICGNVDHEGQSLLVLSERRMGRHTASHHGCCHGDQGSSTCDHSVSSSAIYIALSFECSIRLRHRRT
jgi:hypothetical protein